VTPTYDQARDAAREKAAQADYGSPFRFELTRLVPRLIRRYCPAPADALDVGCGSGRYALFFIEADVTGTYTGVDISEERWSDLPLPADFPGRREQLDAHELGTLNRQFDFVISLTAYEHFADDHRVARGMAAVMKPQSHALIAVPAHFSYPLYGEHGYRRYSAGAVRRLAKQAGLTVVELRRVGGLCGWLFHFGWFFPAKAMQLAGKAALYGAHGMNKKKARARFPRLTRTLDEMGLHHLRWAWGRTLHRACLQAAAKCDRFLPLLEVGYLAVLRKPSPGNARAG